MMKSRILVLSLLILKCVLSAGLEYRLSKSVKPESYDIWIKPYIQPEDGAKQFTFDGEVNITLYAYEGNIKQITLHKDYIEVKQVNLYEADGEKLREAIPASSWSYEQATDKLTLSLQQALGINVNYRLRIVYVGQIRNGMAGVFRANYLDVKGENKTIVLTQAQRIDARTIFPCFDEPAFKAQFRMRISRPENYISIFNTRLVHFELESNTTDRYIDTFAWTPKMSTYLVAFMISAYVPISKNNDLIIWTRREYSTWITFSQDVAQRTLEAYGDYTGQTYKSLGNDVLQKASSPKFPHNGMENWGLVLYKDEVLVQEPGYTDGWSNKQYALTIIVHETAHMWFGNSVTFEWWSYFWLNEAFARYYQYFLAHELYPEYQLDEQFVTKQLHLIFGTDAMNTTQPLTTNEQLIESPSQVASKFSAITYAKGASIIRMFRNIMGHSNFDAAIRDYLHEFRQRNVVPSDLFKHLKNHWPKNHVVNRDELFRDWTEQVGYPVLYVDLHDKQVITVQQRRFLLDENDGSDSLLKYTVPVTYTTDNEKDFTNLTPRTYFKNANLLLDLRKDTKWVIFNLQQSNYHRVFYGAKLLDAIQAALMEPQHSGIHVLNRAHLLDDLFNFARAGLMDYERVFNFVEYMKTETASTAWYAAFNNLQRVAQRLNVEQQTNFGKFILDITNKVYKKLGFEQKKTDAVLDVYNRNDVIYWNCKYGLSDCNGQAQRLLKTANATNTRPSVDFRATLYCSAIRYGDVSNYNIVDNWFIAEDNASERDLLVRALGCTKHFVETHFMRILSDDAMKTQTQLALKPLYAENAENVSPVFKMITARYVDLQARLGSWSALADVISDCANYFTTQEQQQSLDEFITAHGTDFGSSLVTLQRASSNVADNLQWAEDKLKNLNNYLANRNGATFASLTILLLSLSAIVTWTI